MVKQKYINALNRLDELASLAVQDDFGEAVKLQDDYNLLFDLLKDTHKIDISFSQNDLEDLLQGKNFTWTYPTQEGLEIEVLLTNEDYLP